MSEKLPERAGVAGLERRLQAGIPKKWKDPDDGGAGNGLDDAQRPACFWPE